MTRLNVERMRKYAGLVRATCNRRCGRCGLYDCGYDHCRCEATR